MIMDVFLKDHSGTMWVVDGEDRELEAEGVYPGMEADWFFIDFTCCVSFWFTV